MRIRNRSYAAAFAASATVASLSAQQSADALQTSTLFSSRTKQLQHIRSSTTSSTVQCKASRADTSSQQQQTDRIRIRRKANGAPVVDSVLLQFISEQQSMPDVFQQQSNADTDDQENSNAAAAVSSRLETAQASERIPNESTTTKESYLSMNIDDNSSSDETTTNISNADANNSYQSTTEEIKQKLTAKDFSTCTEIANSSTTPSPQWMAQFQSQKVAQTLLDETDLVDEALAKTAGDAVERYVVVRTARRRIRRFLKERDTLWANTNLATSSSSKSELESLASKDLATSPAGALLLESASSSSSNDESSMFDANPPYGFRDVLKTLLEYGLTGTDLAVLLQHSPNLALRIPNPSFLKDGGPTDRAETLEETLERSLQGLLRTTLGLRKYDARKVLRQCPGLLSIRGSKSALQVIAIMTKLGVSESSLARDKASLPILLSRSPSGLFRLVAFLSSRDVMMPVHQIGPLLRNSNSKDLMDALLPVPTVGENDWSKTRWHRQETIERTYAGMTQTARTLRTQIGTHDLSRVVAAYPNVLLLDAEKQILPVARYLMGGLGIWKDKLSKVLQLYPALLGSTIDDLESVVSYVLSLGVEENDLAGMFRAFPGLFAVDLQQMRAVVAYLESIEVRDIGSFVTKLPPILGYDVDTELKPKYEFLKTVCLQPQYELAQFPAYFSYPLERVIKTRFNYLAYKGISIRFVSMRIDTVLRFGDVDFATKVAMDDDRGEAFRAFGTQRGSRGSWSNGANSRHNRRRQQPTPENNNKNNKKKSNHKKRNNHNRKTNNNTPRSRFEKRYNKNRRNNNDNDSGNDDSLEVNIATAKDIKELNKSFREAMPVRNNPGRNNPSPKKQSAEDATEDVV